MHILYTSIVIHRCHISGLRRFTLRIPASAHSVAFVLKGFRSGSKSLRAFLMHSVRFSRRICSLTMIRAALRHHVRLRWSLKLTSEYSASAQVMICSCTNEQTRNAKCPITSEASGVVDRYGLGLGNFSCDGASRPQ